MIENHWKKHTMRLLDIKQSINFIDYVYTIVALSKHERDYNRVSADSIVAEQFVSARHHTHAI